MIEFNVMHFWTRPPSNFIWIPTLVQTLLMCASSQFGITVFNNSYPWRKIGIFNIYLDHFECHLLYLDHYVMSSQTDWIVSICYAYYEQFFSSNWLNCSHGKKIPPLIQVQWIDVCKYHSCKKNCKHQILLGHECLLDIRVIHKVLRVGTKPWVRSFFEENFY